MILLTTCPPDTYKDHLAKTQYRKVFAPRLSSMREAFGSHSESQNTLVNISSSLDYEFSELYRSFEVSNEILEILNKRMFKVTYQGQLLTSETRIHL